MANFNSTQHAMFVADPRQAIRTQDLGGRVRVMRADLDATDLAQNDTITLGRLPAGAQVLATGIKSGQTTASLSVDVGHAGDVDAYVDGQSLATPANAWVNAATYVRLDEETDIIATLLGANPASDTYDFTILYVVD